MPKSLNLCQFIGNLGQDPDIKYTKEGSAVANISIGVSDDYKDKSGNVVAQTNWVRVVAFGRTAEIIGQYLKKGSKIYVSGKQVTRKWQDQNGQDRYTTEIVANEMQMLDTQSGGQAEQGGGYPQQAQQSYQQQPQRQQQAPQQQGGYQQQPQQHYQQQPQRPQQAQNPAPPPAMDSFDDDIPFN